MFSRKEKPTGKRPPSIQSDRSRTSDETVYSGYGPRYDDRTADAAPTQPAVVPVPRPMALPPIPRVASQYGPHGPVNMSELERRLMNFELEESRLGPNRMADGMQLGYGRIPRTQLETIQDTEAPLTGTARFQHAPQDNERRAAQPPRPRTTSSNFSRPRPVQQPQPPAEAKEFQRPPYEETTKPPLSRQPESTVRLVPGVASITHDPASTIFPADRAKPNPPDQRASIQPVQYPSRPPASMPPPPPPSTSTVPPPPLRPPPAPPSTKSAPPLVRPKTAPSDRESPPEFAAIRPGADSTAARPTGRGLRPFRRSTDEASPQINRAAPPPPLIIIPPNPMQNGGAMGEPSGLRPPSAKWSSSESTASTIAPPADLASTKPNKTVRSRFNPISLLTRRKTGQTSRPPPSEPFSPPLPDDFDPRIRGSVIHDFSAPRPRPATAAPPQASSKFPPRTTSINQGIPQSESFEYGPPKKASPQEHPRTPVFIENFGDDTEAWRLNESDRRNKDATGIAERVPDQVTKETISSMPVFARRTPPDALALGPAAPPPRVPLPPTPQAPKPTPQIEARQTPANVGESPTERVEMAAPQPGPQTPPTGSRSPSVSGSGGLLAPTPARLKSNASSRFSFDLAGVGSSAQEKLLEEKHRQRTAQKARESAVSGMSIVETDDEDNGYDDVNFDDFDEEIPGMSSDDDDPFPHVGKVSDFVLPPSKPPTETKASGLQNSWSLSQPIEALPISDARKSSINGSGPTRNTGELRSAKKRGDLEEYQKRLKEMEQQMVRSNFVDDDLYFDDGDVDTVDGDEEPFDESVFDDENNTMYTVPLRDQSKPQQAPQEITHSDSSQQSTRPISLDSTAQTANNAKATTDTSRTSVQPADGSSTARKPPALDTIPQGGSTTASLTQDNLAAYHDALAYAANKAAREGRFDRKMSMDESSSEVEHGIRPHVSFNERELGPRMPLTEENVLDFDFDDLDNMDDDDVIAAANAEALENDDEGFYGTEFGFYASGGTDAERVHGGYFGSSFNDLVKRSHSGRAKDPSLTPITERSEWSQRNSMISLALQTGSERYSAAHTPGLAQLADSLQYNGSEDNLSLSALMKLRRGAFGDSTSSLPSSAGSHKSGSPSGVPSGFMFPQPPTIGPVPHTAAQPRNNSGTNISMGPPELPSRLQQFSGPGIPVLSPTPPAAASGIYHPDRGANPSPNLRTVGKAGSHSRTSSGAESVTYMKERDEEGGRWVMERRRTSEAGEVEILGRQFLEGQRI